MTSPDQRVAEELFAALKATRETIEAFASTIEYRRDARKYGVGTTAELTGILRELVGIAITLADRLDTTTTDTERIISGRPAPAVPKPGTVRDVFTVGGGVGYLGTTGGVPAWADPKGGTLDAFTGPEPAYTLHLAGRIDSLEDPEAGIERLGDSLDVLAGRWQLVGKRDPQPHHRLDLWDLHPGFELLDVATRSRLVLDIIDGIIADQRRERREPFERSGFEAAGRNQHIARQLAGEASAFEEALGQLITLIPHDGDTDVITGLRDTIIKRARKLTITPSRLAERITNLVTEGLDPTVAIAEASKGLCSEDGCGRQLDTFNTCPTHGEEVTP